MMSDAAGSEKVREAGQQQQQQPQEAPPAYSSTYPSQQQQQQCQPYYDAGHPPQGQAYGYAPGYTYPTATDNKGYTPDGSTQQPAQVVIVQQPVFGVPLTNPPNDYFAYAIFVTLCCFWPLGIFAILKASNCREEIARGNREMAESRSRQARNMANIALGIGIGSIILSAIIITVYIVSIVNSSDY